MSSAVGGIAEVIKRPVRVLAEVDISSWVSWACYTVGFVAASVLCPTMVSDFETLSLGLVVTVTAHVAFFVAITFIQKHMQFSLAANTYGSPERLVTSGVFKYSRNPIYLAFFMPLAALAYFSLAAAGFTLALYVLCMNRFVIRAEEQVLEAEFGDEFRAYLSATPRWLLVG